MKGRGRAEVIKGFWTHERSAKSTAQQNSGAEVTLYSRILTQAVKSERATRLDYSYANVFYKRMTSSFTGSF